MRGGGEVLGRLGAVQSRLAGAHDFCPFNSQRRLSLQDNYYNIHLGTNAVLSPDKKSYIAMYHGNHQMQNYPSLIYQFLAEWPYQILAMELAPFEWRTKPVNVTFTTTLVQIGRDQYLLGYGVNDHRMEVVQLSWAQLTAGLQPVESKVMPNPTPTFPPTLYLGERVMLYAEASLPDHSRVKDLDAHIYSPGLVQHGSESWLYMRYSIRTNASSGCPVGSLRNLSLPACERRRNGGTYVISNLIRCQYDWLHVCK